MIHRSSRRDARLASGLILFGYVATHLANHALGSLSMATAERGLRIAMLVWQSVPGTVLLYGAAATHVALAFAAVYERRTLRMPPLELLRMVLGFSMPTLLIGHAVATRLAFTIQGHPPDYAHVVWTLQHSGRQGLQIALLVPGWLHGCLGLRFAFGRHAWFERLRPVLFGAALLLPVLAVLGFVAMTKEVNVLAADPAWAARTAAVATPREREELELLRSHLLLGYGAAIAAMLLVRRARAFFDEHAGALIRITYPDRAVRVPRGWSVLEASRAHGIAHRSSCGGQGRCSTCRVRVVAGTTGCPPPHAAERATLARVGAEPDVRLACQLRPDRDVAVVPLIRAPGPGMGAHRDALERDVVALRIGVRWSRSFHRLLPHDRLYAVHRFHDAVEAAVHRSGITIGERATDHMTLWAAVGRVGDARRALTSVFALADACDTLATELARTIGCRMDLVIALHRGPVVFGESNVAGDAASVAVGDAVDAVTLATRRVATDAGPNPTAVLVSTTLLDAVPMGLAFDAASESRHVELADGRTVGFVAVARHGTRRVTDEAPRDAAMQAVDGATH